MKRQEVLIYYSVRLIVKRKRAEKIGDGRRKFWTKPLKQINLDMAGAIFDP